MTYENTYSPSPEFRDALESEVLRTYRRAELRAIPLEKRRRSLLRVAVIALVSIVIGTTAGLASAQISRGAERDSLLEAANANAALAKMRLDLAQLDAARVTRMANAGAVDADEAARANAQVRAMQMQLGRAMLDITEIKASGRAPRDDLGAPLVAGKDFVKQRIQLEAVAAQQTLVIAESALERAQRQVRVGAVSDGERLVALVNVAKARSALAILAEKLQLRAQAVEKHTPVETLMSQLEKSQIRQDLVVAQQELEVARSRMGLVEKQFQAGVVDDVQRLRAQLEVREREEDLRRLAARLRGKP